MKDAHDLHIEKHSKIGGALKEAVFGFNDGVVSTFAVIAGLTGGLTSEKTVLLGALATLVAGAFSMGLGTYLGSKSEKDLYERERHREIDEINNIPERERQEIRDIYADRGFKGELLEKVVDTITSDRKVWLKVMMQEELGFATEPPTPGLDGIVMSCAFVIGSFLPTLPFLLPAGFLRAVQTCGSGTEICPAEYLPAVSVSTFSKAANAATSIPDSAIAFFNANPVFTFSLVLSVIGLVAIGTYKTRFTGKNKTLSALETLGIGILSGGGSYVVGVLIGG